MTRHYNILYVAALAALMLSCTREEFAPEVEDSGRIQLKAAIAGTNATLTKATVEKYNGLLSSTSSLTDSSLYMGILRVDQVDTSYNNGKGLSKLNYKVADSVVIGNSTSYDTQKYTYISTPHYYVMKGSLAGAAGLKEVDFPVLQYFKEDNDIVHYYGWLPYGKPVANGSDTLKVNFDLNGKTDVLYSDIATQKMNSTSDTLKLHHALCQYRIWVYRKAEIGESGNNQGVGRWGRITELTAEKQRGTATLTLPSKISYSGTPTDLELHNKLPKATLDHGTITGASNGVFFVTSEIVTKDNSSADTTHTGVTIPVGLDKKQMVACFLAPPPADSTFSIKVKTDATEDSERQNQKELTVAGNFQAGKAYDIILCFSDHGVINASATVNDWKYYENIVNVDVEAKMYYDLSRYGTANCYMVSSANVGYSFQGNVKGCGNDDGGGDVVGVSDCSLPDNSYVEVLYQSCDSLIQLDSRLLINGKVVFWVPGYADESSLALKRKGNAIIAVRKGNGGEILWSWHIWVTDRPLDQGYLNGYDVMDRNLGATKGPHTVSQIKAATDSTYGLYYQWGRKDPMIPGKTTWSTESLTKETPNSDGVPDGTGNCISTGIKNPLVMYSNWNVDDIDAIMGYLEEEDNVKSIYDPCPPGYRAPESEAFKGLSNFRKDVDDRNTGAVKGGAFSGDQSIYFFYPDAGFIYAGGTITNGAKVAISEANNGSTSAGSNIYLYTTAPDDFVDGATGEIVKIDSLPNGTGGTNFNTKQESSAFSVRCISTGSKARVTNLCESQTANCYIVSEYGGYKFRVDVKGNGVDRVNIGGDVVNIFENASTTIPLSSINHVAVLWWQGDLSAGSKNNTAGTDCPIKFVNTGKTLPRTPAHTSTDFGSKDLTVPDEDGYVQFYIKEDEWSRGNAVIAAFDADNNVLWSWHIWLTDEPSIIDLGPTTSTTDSYTYEYSMMDRNLGATYHPTSAEFSAKALSGTTTVQDSNALASIGLYYQWGRKDPIQGADAFSTITAESASTASRLWFKRKTSGDYSWESMSAVQIEAAQTEPAYSIGKPWLFFTNNTNASTIFGISFNEDYFIFEKNWYSYQFGASTSLMNEIRNNTNTELVESEVAKFIGRWGYNTPVYSTQPKDPVMTKTLHDPCPPGYYMPPTGILTAMGATDDVSSGTELTNSSTSWSASKTWSAGSETKGLFAASPTFAVSSTVWIPFGGYRDFADGHFNTSVFNFSTTPVAVWSSALDYESKYYRYYSGVRSLVVSGTGGGQLKGQRPADGTNVRCRAY